MTSCDGKCACDETTPTHRVNASVNYVCNTTHVPSGCDKPCDKLCAHSGYELLAYADTVAGTLERTWQTIVTNQDYLGTCQLSATVHDMVTAKPTMMPTALADGVPDGTVELRLGNTDATITCALEGVERVLGHVIM